MQAPTVYIISPQITPRLEYVTDFIFRQVLGCGLQISNSRSPGMQYIIEYGTTVEDGVRMPSCGLLWEQGIRREWLAILTGQDKNCLFAAGEGEGPDFDQDLFALVFFFLSRYEEYLPYSGDALGRFCAGDSLAYQKNILQIPLVDHAIHWIRSKLKEKFDLMLPSPVQRFCIRPTLDVDQIWAYHRKGWKNIGGGLKDLLSWNIPAIKNRWRARQDVSMDPFHTWALLDEIHEQCDIRPIFFMLLAPEGGRLDKNHSPFDPEVQRQILQIAEKNEIGLHPSAQSRQNGSQLMREKKILEQITGREVKRSRMHYLLMSLPGTYRMLLDFGLEHDFTMGFHDAVGYRAGTGYDFYWYDLERECQTRLRVTPFQVMDVSLKVHLKLQPHHAMAIVSDMIETARHYDSPLTTIWHNSSFYDLHGWAGWEQVYRGLIAKNTSDGSG
ncbi:MAG: polysaccharide deacetylase family protein [Saprospiraceae bacterium]|nr:polysaccharide deacetylase family protein [Saprospiraceae bacterium]